jgi:DNA adenine methylase
MKLVACIDPSSTLTITTAPRTAPAPIVKYAGGKTKLLPELLARMPARFGRYYEPFAGGAALFFRVDPDRAVLGDSNADLMLAYTAIASDVESVIAALERHRTKHRRRGERHYLAVREAWNAGRGTRVERAAMLLCLNRTCFNGLWRVNRAGEFNVPMGRYSDPLAGMADRLRAARRALAAAELRIGDYRATIHDARRGDFVYFDPPYDGGWNSYTAEPFDDAAQAELAYEVRRLAQRGVRVMLSNADTPRIRALYAGLRIDVVRCPRAINSDTSRRGAVDEVIVTAGYEPKNLPSWHATRKPALAEPMTTRRP